MAPSALSPSLENLFAAHGRNIVRTGLGRSWRRNGKLIKMKRRQLEVIKSESLRTSFEPALTAIGYCTLSFNRGSKKVPLPCISRFETSAFQYVVEPNPVQVPRFTPARPKAGGMSTAADFPFGWKRFSVQEELSIELSGTPGVQDGAHSRLVSRQEMSGRGEIGRQGDDRAYIQIAIRPSIQAVANAFSERIINGRVAQRALNTH